MESAFAWIGQIIEWLGKFVPRLVIVDITKGVVKLKYGNEIEELKPGHLHWYWPLTSIIKEVDIARQTLDLTTQTFETKDGVTVQVSGMITYQVQDAVALLTTVYDPDNTIRDIGMAGLQEVLVQYTWAELRDHLVDGTLRKELTRETQRELRTFGVKVLKVGIKDLARTRVYKVALEQSTDGLH